jgi:isopenicillin-N N-acyltransferase-like protein
MSLHFPYIRVAGGPAERGRQYGVAAAARIRAGLAIYAPSFTARGMDWNEVRRLAGRFVGHIEAFDQDILRELEGIAAGAELPVEDIIVLNARTELLFGVGASNDFDDGCTAAAALPSATATGHVLHGQNWDWRADCIGSTVILHVLPDTGPEFITLVEAGGLARCGLNAAGEHDDGDGGIPLSMIRRKALQSDSYTAAAGVILRTPTSFSNNVMLSFRDGAAVDFEKTPIETFWIEPENGVLVHANHFASPSARAKVKDLSLPISPDTLHRSSRVLQALSRGDGLLTIDDFKAAFADRFGYPFAVCRPPIAQDPGSPVISTVATIIMDVTQGEFHVAAAPYDGASYVTYTLESRVG